MRNFKGLVSFTALLCVALFVSACGGPKPEAPANTPPVANNKAPAPPSGGTNDTQSSIAGDYTVTGTNVDGAGNYSAGLTITPRDDVFQFTWTSDGETYEGVGVQTGKKVAVAFTEGADGTGCGVVLYDVTAEGNLNGKAGYWGVNSFETETAKRVSGTDRLVNYEVSGTNTDGAPYKGTLKIEEDGEGYSFEWNTGSVVKGFGIQQNETATAGIGGPQCAFVAYDIKPDGTLEGKWGGQSTKTFGTETAKKK